MAQDTVKTKKPGILVTGIVSEISDYTNRDSGVVSFSLHIFIPGSRALMKIRLNDPPAPDLYVPMQPVQLYVSLSEYKGNINFNEAAT